MENLKMVEPLLLDTKTACNVLGIGRTMLFKLLADNALIRKRVGRKTLVTMESIKAFAERGQGNMRAAEG